MARKEVQLLRNNIREQKKQLRTLVDELNDKGADVCSISRMLISVSEVLIDLQTQLNSLTSNTDEQKLLAKSARRTRKKQREEAKKV